MSHRQPLLSAVMNWLHLDGKNFNKQKSTAATNSTKSDNATLDTSIKPFLKESGSTEKSNFPPFFSNGFASRVQSPSASS